MKKKHFNLLFLFISILIIFIIGVVYEIDYRILTRRVIKYLSKIKIDYYGGKEFRIFETDIAFILTLIPISIFILVKKLSSVISKFFLTLLFLISCISFYFLYCYLETYLIEMTITNLYYNHGVLMIHSNNIDYRLIAFTTITSSFVIGIMVKLIIKKNYP